MTRAYLTLTEAAQAADRSRVTLRRYLDAGRFPNAKRDEDDANRHWLIPVADLRAAGVDLRLTHLTDAPEASPCSVRLAVAEAIAAERLEALERIGHLAEALRAQAEAISVLHTRRPDDPR